MESKKQYHSRLNWFKNRRNTSPLFYIVTLTVFSLSFFFFVFFFFSSFAINLITTKTTPCQDRMIRCQMTSTKPHILNIQESENLFKKIIGKKEMMMMPKSTKSEVSPMRLTAITRRFLGGPGSWPPRCTSKCGRCSPCKPVHVAVPPGTPVTTEYYPEAWRCKCGNRLFMP